MGMKIQEDQPTKIWVRAYPWARFLRGGTGTPMCRDELEPDPNNIQMQLMPDGTYAEGYVCVTPYFPTKYNTYFDSLDDCPLGQIKVCALDAQSAAVSNTGTVCAEAKALDPGCGCGPSLNRCSQFAAFNNDVLASLDHQITWVLNNNRPYYEMLSDSPPFVNGRLVHYYRHMAQDAPFPKEMLPDLAYTDGSWHEVPVGPHYSGVLTHPVYLTRFQTNRARTDRFYNSFLCQPFQPPVGGLPTATNEQMQEPDLQKRAGCKYCHSTIEPVGAYWGHWAEFRAGYLDAQNYPDFDPVCLQCAQLGNCDSRCALNYVTAVGSASMLPYQGWLRAYLFRAEEDWNNILQGPSLLVQRTVLDGRLPSCAARNTVVWLMGRQLLPDEESWLNDIVSVFAASNYDYRALVHAVVTSDFYRRVR